MFAGHLQLDNLIAVIDRNWLCVTDFTENVIRLEPLQNKWGSFGWEVVCINGHCFEEILAAFKNSLARSSTKPLIIIANTIKGKGFSFMENNVLWHYRSPDDQEYEQALKEIE